MLESGKKGRIMRIKDNLKPMTSDEIHADILQRIIDLELEPGARLIEKDIANYYGVSRSVIRPIFAKLEQRKLICVFPQRGSYVNLINLELNKDILLLRFLIEREAIECLMHKDNLEEIIARLEKNVRKQGEHWNLPYSEEFKALDVEFHEILIKSTDRQGLLDIIEGHMVHVARWRNFYVLFYDRVKELITEHRAILKGIQEKDVKKASKAMSEHLKTVEKVGAYAIKEKPDYFEVLDIQRLQIDD